ncbi:DNA polymerase III subunit alpha [Flexithrix dorotheae]|uniref:DNA polymerase III subunit alpha n=1 Tax=Flexithrix dorotheae TaxID=70993 RepID=UPI001FDEAD2F|nr:DNA polymerase III subunit alpha [Flexithrix dorotheae]
MQDFLIVGIEYMYLNCHTYYSFRYGTLSPKELVEEALRFEVETLVLTDINNTSAVFDFIGFCREKGIKPVVGIEFRSEQKEELEYIGIAQNNEGFRELNELLSGRQEQAGDIFRKKKEDCKHVFFIYPFNPGKQLYLPGENEFIGIGLKDITKVLAMHLNGVFAEKMVVLHPVSIKNRKDFATHKLLRSIDMNKLLSMVPETATGRPDEYFVPISKLKQAFSLLPDIVRNTEHLLDTCEITLDLRCNKNRKTYTGDLYNDRMLLEKLAYEGLEYRYGKDDKEAAERVRNELELIEKLEFASYFLITWDITGYATNRDIVHVGRGSGANSIVAYCMKITDVDPMDLGLYFERFINPERTSPPDFDIDFSWKDRDVVIDYMFKKFGPKHTALLASYNTFHERSVVRELGKVFGLPKLEIDRMIEEPEHPDCQHKIAKTIRYYGKKIAGFPNYLSIHAGGVLISEAPITSYTPLELPPKNFNTVQFDMYVAEEIGLYKFDILSQRGLGHITEAVEIIRENQGEVIDIHRVKKFKKDRLLLEKVKQGKTIGCFYVESPAMRGLLTKLMCNSYLDIVAASSIIRPGVAKSGMMREYISRFHNPEGFKYLHPKMEKLLKETFGIMIYQEDVIKVAHHFAGLDLIDADVLRRIMSGKKRVEDKFEKIRIKFFENCNAFGYPEKISKEVWRQIESFSGYSFSKAHSASYAVESFQSLYLKTYFPLEFMVAVINNFGGFYKTEFYVHEARMAGATIHAPCINNSEYLTTIRGKEIYLGFIHLQNSEKKIIAQLVKERKNGLYKDLRDLAERVPIKLEQLIILIRIGAFRFTGVSKKVLLWEAHTLMYRKQDKKLQETTACLFSVNAKKYNLPELEEDEIENIYDEIELLGFPLCSPFELLKTNFRGEVEIDELINHVGKSVRIVGYYVCQKSLRTSGGKPMAFGTWLCAKGNFFDTTHFPNSLKKYPFRGTGLYLIKGKIVEDFGFSSIEVEKMAKLGVKGV